MFVRVWIVHDIEERRKVIRQENKRERNVEQFAQFSQGIEKKKVFINNSTKKNDSSLHDLNKRERFRISIQNMVSS